MFSPRAPPSVLSNRRPGRRPSLTAEISSWVNQESRRREQIISEEASENARLLIAALSVTASSIGTISDRELTERDTVRRAEDRAWMLIIKSAFGSKQFWESNSPRRVETTRARAAEPPTPVPNAADKRSAVEGLADRPLAHKPKPPSIRPPSAFPNDQTYGREMWEREKAHRAMHASVLLSLLELDQRESQRRGSIEADECLTRLRLANDHAMENRQLRKVISQNSAANTRGEVAREILAARRMAGALQVQCWWRKCASLSQVRRRQRAVNQHVAEVHQVCEARFTIASTVNGYLCRRQLSAVPRSSGSEIGRVEQERVSSKSVNLEHDCYESLSALLEAASVPGEDAAALLVLFDSATGVHWQPAVLHDVLRSVDGSKYEGIDLLRKCLGQQPNRDAESPKDVSKPQTLVKSTEYPGRFDSIELIARSYQPPAGRGVCSIGMACLFAATYQQHQDRLPYCERILHLNGFETGTETLRAAVVHFNPSFKGLNLIADASVSGLEFDLPSISYLLHAQACVESNLVNGRIDVSCSPSRWRPYTSVAELYEEERQQEIRREDCDRYDLQAHERNSRTEIVDLWVALSNMY